MELKPKIYELLIALIVISLFTQMLTLSFLSPYPDGRDAWFHILVARAWLKGMNGMISPVVIELNGLPYPPLFHLLLVPFVANLETALLAAKTMQLIYYPLGTLLLMLLVRKYSGSKMATVYGLCLVGTYFAFTQMQARPQSLETLFYPIAVWSLMENRKKTFILSNVVMFYIHSPISLAFILGLMIYAFRQDKRESKIWITALIIAPLVVYQATYIFNQVFFDRWFAAGDLGILDETKQFLSNPLFWLLNGLGLNIISFATIPPLLYRWKSQTRFTQIMLYSFFGMLIVAPTWYQRTLTIAIMPIAYFTALTVLGIKNKYLKIILLGALISQAVWFSLTPVWWMSPAPYFDKYW